MTANRPLNDAEALAALEWYRAVGVDVAVGELPVDRFATSQIVPRRVATAEGGTSGAAAAILNRATPPAPVAEAPAIIVNADPSETRALAAEAKTLDELRAIMEAYDGCVLKKRATQLVFADGNPEAEIMLVGEGPGADEDRIGKPFVGRAGQLLDRMLASIGLDRTKVFIANMVPWRPPGNREPTPEEMALCTPFLHRQIELVAPKILVTLGNVPTQSLFDTKAGITRTRGQWRQLTVNSHTMQAIATLHPAYLLRQPAAKAQAWRDMLALKAMITKEVSAGF
ncbi:MAG TPA: uracil-DNA glycosylase [Devosiaceae bacterium]|nr:uracil-DNA glycosylase [Devosiaceae bacterium]